MAQKVCPWILWGFILWYDSVDRMEFRIDAFLLYIVRYCCLCNISVRSIILRNLYLNNLFHKKSFRIILDPTRPDGHPFLYILIAIWSSFVLAEQLCITFLLTFKSRMNTGIVVTYILCICLILASGSVRSYKGLAPWLQDYSKGIHTRYSSSLLHSATFLSRKMNCTKGNGVECPEPKDFLLERLGVVKPQETTDIAVSVAFAIGMAFFNLILYLLPMPRCIRMKFRE